MTTLTDCRDIISMDAAVLSAAIHRREISCVEVMTAYLNHIERVNPAVNAIVMLRPRAELLAEARRKDDQMRDGDDQGWMHGFPHAVKDLADVAGFPTTHGFYQPNAIPVATADSIAVERIRAVGAIFIGKTNAPEFGLGSNTYNAVFGTTYNAYDQTTSAGGSSGGAAVAVALRMLPVADGSDFMGSLRNPPGWNNVFGLRPSFGRVPGGGEVFISQGGVSGPIARTARDLALLLVTMAGPDARSPLALPDVPARPGDVFEPVTGKRVAWLGDLGGYLPMEPEVLGVCRSALDAFTALGMDVETLDELPADGAFRGTGDLWPIWLTYRHWLVGGKLHALYADPAQRARLKPEIIYEVEGLINGADGNPPITGLDIYRMSEKRSGMYAAFERLFRTYDYIVLPTAQVFPFDPDQHWPKTINGVEMSSYHRWMEVTTIGTLLNAPTLAMPAGFSASGLPIGLQVIGRNHDDASLIDLAHAWERETRLVQHVPPILSGEA